MPPCQQAGGGFYLLGLCLLAAEFMEIKWIFIPTWRLSSVNCHVEPSQRDLGWHRGDLHGIVSSQCGLLHASGV